MAAALRSCALLVAMALFCFNARLRVGFDFLKRPVIRVNGHGCVLHGGLMRVTVAALRFRAAGHRHGDVRAQ